MFFVNRTYFNKLLFSTCTVENGVRRVLVNEEANYLGFHADRYYKTYRLLATVLEGRVKPRVLDIGLNPHLTGVLASILDADFSGVWGGHRLDGRLDEKSSVALRVQVSEQEHSIQVSTGYNIERDALPYPDHSFDAVMFLEIIEHFIIDPVFALKEISRVLKPDGVMVLTTDNSHSLIKLMKFLTFRPIYWPYSDSTFGDRHNREYLPEEVRTLLEGIGFRHVQIRLENLNPYQRHGSAHKRIGYFLSGFLTCLPGLRRFRRQVFATAQKGEARNYYPEWLFMRGRSSYEN